MALAMTERWPLRTTPQQTPLSPLRGQLPSRGASFCGGASHPTDHHFTATASTSTRAALGRAATWKQERAGASVGK